MKLNYKQAQRQKQTQKMKLVYVASFAMVFALIGVFSFVFNIGNIRTGFATPVPSTIVAAKSGNWDATSTWTGGVVPTSNNPVTISNGYTVTVNTTTAACKSITLGGSSLSGTITFATSGSPVLTIASGVYKSASSGASGTLTMQSGATLNAYSLDATITNNLNAGTVNYVGTTSILATTYNNLTITGGSATINSASGTPSSSGTATLTGATTVNGILTIASGTLSASSYALDLKGNFVNSGTFTEGTGTVTFDNTALQTIGSTSTTFYNLVINNAAGVTLTTPVTVSHALTLSAGILKLGSNKLTISSGATISGYGTTHFIETNSTGVLEMTAAHATGTLFPIGDGFDPIKITPTTDATFDVSVANGATDKAGVSLTSHIVNATWTVTMVSGSTQNVVVSPAWFTSDELTSFTRTSSYVSTRTSTVSGNPGATWVPSAVAGTASTSSVGNWTISSGNISMALSTPYYTGIGDNVSALPVTLVSFNANYENSKVELTWATASEINNHYFDIERSTDGKNWQSIGREDGHGNSNTRQEYAETDDLGGIIPSGDIYYRLKQVDFNGTSTYSMIRSVKINGSAGMALNVYPNPVVNELNVNWNSDDNVPATLRIVSISGAEMYSEIITGTGQMHKLLDMTNFKTGTYVLQIVTGKNVTSKTIVKR